MATDDMDWFNRQVASFQQQLPIYEDFSHSLKEVLDRAVIALQIPAIVQVRPKEVASFAEKCIRKRARYADPINQFTDLCGARVIVESKDQIKPVCDYIVHHFEIDEANSEDVIERLGAGEFGYLSVHYIVSFKDGVIYDGVEIPNRLLERYGEEDNSKGHSPGPKYRAEVQVRTLLQHAWATLIHDHLYKSDFKAPRHLEREAGRIAALLEDSDDSFVRLLEGVKSYRSCYGAYMSNERVRKEIEILEAVQRYDPDNAHLAHKIARLAMAIDDWDKAVRTLEEYKSSSSPQMAAILRDLGVALRRKGDSEGLKLIEKAVELNPLDVDARCELGDACFPLDSKEALCCYEDAFRLAPTYPRALRGFLQCKIMRERNLDFISLLRPDLEAAIRTCREWAEVGVHLPWAFYDMGFFALLLGRAHESLDAFCRAIQLSATESPIEEACLSIEELQEELGNRSSELAEPLEWVRRLLLVATVGKLMAMEEAFKGEAERLGILAGRAQRSFERLSGDPGVKEEERAAAQNKARDAEEASEKARRKWMEAKTRAAEALGTYLSNPNRSLKGKRTLATKQGVGGTPVFDKERRVVIVAGGCDAKAALKIGEYRILLESALKGFDGAVICGGTTAGVSGIVGNLADPAGAIKRIAYLPESLPRGDMEHDAYKVHPIPGAGYTPFGPIQGWVDLLVSGIRPGDVRVIGINGGELSGFEVRLGLVMGAKVGVLRESGGEATRISDAPEWKSSPGLVLLPTDEETVRLFLQPPPPSKVITDEDKEKLAREAHEEHRRNRSRSLMPPDPALAEWDELIPSLRTSNHQQVDHIEAKLERFGLKLRKVEDRDIQLFPFTDEQIEVLAEVEHARWNVERLLDRWTLGERDPIEKTTPYLVPWRDLSPDVRKWDRDTVTSLAERLKALGYEIYRP